MNNWELNVMLYWAAGNGQLDIIKCLVENGADIHAWEDYALRCACSYGQLDMVKYLIEKGANIHAYNDEALRYATGNGYLEIVEYLIEKGVKPQKLEHLMYMDLLEISKNDI